MVTIDRMVRMENDQTNSANGSGQLRRRSLMAELKRRDGLAAANLLMGALPGVAGQALREIKPGRTTAILEWFAEDSIASVRVGMGCFLRLATIPVT